VAIGNMEVVEQRAPRSVLGEDGAGEADQAAVLGEDRATLGIGLTQSVGPHGQAVCHDVAIEEGVGVGAPVVMSPAVSVKIGDGLRIGRTGEAER
jgi:hypothetical protein